VKIAVASVTRDEWIGNKEHPYRNHKAFKCNGVPTLILFDGDKEITRA